MFSSSILSLSLKSCGFYIRERRIHSLITDKGYINGSWVTAKSGKMFDVTDPSNGKIIASVPDMNLQDLDVAIKSANEAFKIWKTTTSKERSDLLKKWHNLLVANQGKLAELLTLEAGKPLKESAAEVNYGNGFIEWFAEESRRMYGEIVPSPVKTRELIFIKQPIGVVGLITPWNFPVAMVTRKAGAALAAGCTCIIKPAEDTPFTALALAKFAESAGIPKGVINVVTSSRSNAAALGKELCENSLVAGISFTGSTEVGKLLYKQCAGGVKRISLELGGNAPFIVFDGADIDKAVDGAIGSKFRNCGQTCVSANRFLIQQSMFDKFVHALKTKIESTLVVGDGKNYECNVGPLINMAQVNKVDELVQDAVKNGATVVTGGKRALRIGSQFYEPTILTNVTENMRCYKEEIFGPVVVCIKFATEEEGIWIANNTDRGLAGYFYTNDIAQAFRVAKRLEVGMVGVNEGLISHPEAAFGGIKQSGIGREGSRHGLDEYTYLKYICFGNLSM